MNGRKFVARVTLVFAGGVSILLLIDKPAFHNTISNYLSPDTFKTLLQFVLVTLGGGIVFLYLNIVKEEDEKRVADDALKRDLIKDLDKLYRETKHIRWTLKAYCIERPDTAIVVDRKLFEDKLDKLADVQISVEHAREQLEYSDHLFSSEECDKLSSAINYAARFLRGVYRDFQTHKTIIEDNLLVIPQTCANLYDFLSPFTIPDPINTEFTRMRNKKTNMEERWTAFDTVRKSGRRYKIVAEECFKLAASQIDSNLLTPKLRKPSSKRAGTKISLLVSRIVSSRRSRTVNASDSAAGIDPSPGD
jgi:hypothetical protein